jgi:hypothetical protein
MYPHDEDNTLIISLLLEDEEICEEPEQSEDFSQRLKENIRENKKFFKELVDHCKNICILVGIFAQR